MSDYQQKLFPEPMRTINSASFTGSYMPFLDAVAAPSPITNPSRVLLFVNNTGVNVTISWDGVDDHVLLLPGAGFALDETANAVSNAPLSTSAKTQFYAKGVASTGLVYLSTFYAS
jgi:hypothetical protein